MSVSVSVPSGDIDDGAATALQPLQTPSSSTPRDRDTPTNEQQPQQQQQRKQQLSRREKLEHYLAKNAASQRKSLAASLRVSTSSSSSSPKDEETVALRQPLRMNAGTCDSGEGSNGEKPRSASEEYSNYLERLARYQQRKKSFLASSAALRPGVATATARSLVQEKENEGNRDHVSAVRYRTTTRCRL